MSGFGTQITRSPWSCRYTGRSNVAPSQGYCATQASPPRSCANSSDSSQRASCKCWTIARRNYATTPVRENSRESHSYCKAGHRWSITGTQCQFIDHIAAAQRHYWAGPINSGNYPVIGTIRTTDQKVGGSNPSERTRYGQVRGGVVGDFPPLLPGTVTELSRRAGCLR
jgi:hypothetical protein